MAMAAWTPAAVSEKKAALFCSERWNAIDAAGELSTQPSSNMIV